MLCWTMSHPSGFYPDLLGCLWLLNPAELLRDPKPSNGTCSPSHEDCKHSSFDPSYHQYEKMFSLQVLQSLSFSLCLEGTGPGCVF
jgi:hypothetical protein